MTCAYLGPAGSFSEMAALDFTGDPSQLLPKASFAACVEAVESGETDFAVLPVENSIEGSVTATIDLLLHEITVPIVAEIVVPVRHFLIGIPGATFEGIAVVTSHPQPLGQCRWYLERELPHADQVAALSTSAAVEEVVRLGDPGRVAIGTERAAELYGGEIIARDIQDVRANVTRFVVLGNEAPSPTGKDKTSFGFTVKANVPGALFKVMKPFADAGLQLTKVESRPTKSWPIDYFFLVDFEGHCDDPQVAAAFSEITPHCGVLKIFGSFPQFDWSPLQSMFEE